MVLIEITALKLKNIKSYRDAEIKFTQGINGIVGDNGHGKTTILEAIGYALYDYLPINIKDFVRKGEKSGEVSLYILLDDDSEYIIRKGVGKQLFDITLPTGKILKTREDCLNWITDNIFPQARDSKDVSSLFENMVGVPQGHFTSAFDQTPTGRKSIFDRILRLDEYEIVWRSLKTIPSEINKRIEKKEREVIRLEGIADSYDENRKELEQVVHQIQGKQDELDHAQEVLEEETKILETLEELKKKFDSIDRELNRNRMDLKGFEGKVESTEENIKALEKAKKAVAELEDSKKKYLENKDKLEQARQKEKDARQKKEHLLKLKERLTSGEEHIQKLNKEIDSLSISKEFIETNKLLPDQVKELEEKGNELGNKAASLEERKRTLAGKASEAEELRIQLEKKEELEERKKRSEELSKPIKELEREFEQITKKLTELRQELTQVQEFKGSLEEGLCPFLREECKNVQGDLNDYFANRIKAIQSEMGPNAEGKAEIKKKLDQAQAASEELKELVFQLKGLEESNKKLSSLEKELENLKKELEELPDIKGKLESVRKDLEGLKPKLEEFQTHRAKAGREENLKEELEKVRASEKDIEQTIKVLEKELEGVKGLDEQIQNLSKDLKQLEPEYERYQKEHGIMQRFEGAPKQLEELELKTSETNKKIKELEEHLKEMEFDPKKLESSRRDTSAAKEKLSVLTTEFKGLLKNKGEKETLLKKQEDALAKASEMKIGITGEKEYRSFVEFVRDTVRDSGPMVGTEIVATIGRSASEMYSEIVADHSQNLEWSKDYEIILKTPQGERTFKQLSGGEQMSSALAVRMAMLKHLAHSDILFLDEPTANLDDTRRQNLANQIMRVSGFKQVFVITHDDTFSQQYGYIIRVDKKAGTTEVSYA